MKHRDHEKQMNAMRQKMREAGKAMTEMADMDMEEEVKKKLKKKSIEEE